VSSDVSSVEGDDDNGEIVKTVSMKSNSHQYNERVGRFMKRQWRSGMLIGGGECRVAG
jgi:hypothetical protein